MASMIVLLVIGSVTLLVPRACASDAAKVESTSALTALVTELVIPSSTCLVSTSMVSSLPSANVAPFSRSVATTVWRIFSR